MPRAVREAVWQSDGAWTLTLVSGEQVTARLLPSSFVTPGFLILSFRSRPWLSYRLVLSPDALDANLRRRLRVRLRRRETTDRSDTGILVEWEKFLL